MGEIKNEEYKDQAVVSEQNLLERGKWAIVAGAAGVLFTAYNYIKTIQEAEPTLLNQIVASAEFRERHGDSANDMLKMPAFKNKVTARAKELDKEQTYTPEGVAKAERGHEKERC